MKVELVGFSQGVAFTNKNETVNYLDFKTEGGRLFRLPVSSESLDLLMSEVYGSEVEAEKEEEPVMEGEQFGGDVVGVEEAPDDDPYPESENEVPSL
jgi:hypothetical protein